MNLRWGQNAFLSTALIAGGLYLIESNPIMAGLMFGLLTYKPQMAVFIFIVLLLTKQWKVFFWSCISAISFAIISCFIFGLDTWINFYKLFPIASKLIDNDWKNIHSDSTIFNFLP